MICYLTLIRFFSEEKVTLEENCTEIAKVSITFYR